ncbi:lipid droplet-associated hydrolase [Naviculisporaceae sp. PSN 640]
MNRTSTTLRRLSTIKMTTRPPPSRRYPAARSKNAVPCIEFPSPTPLSGQSPRPRRALVYFIPGNPGLAGYYIPFLKTLRGLLDESASRTDEVKVEFDLVSRNLLGFDDADHEPAFGTLAHRTEGEDGEENLPFCLEDQICAVWDALEELVSEKGYDEVILMGHSVGAYIGMEVFHRHHLRYSQRKEPQGVRFTLKAGIMLFPTVWDIAQSPNGMKFDALIRNNGFMDRNAHFIARWIVDWFPGWFLRSIVRRVMGFSDNGAGVTTNFLQSRDGIWQSLYLAKDEMGVITGEKWEREMWEARKDSEDEGQEKDRFFFLFGQKDHWVADKTRDAFIEKRKEHGGGRVKVLVEETGKVPHAFCIHHSEVVAEKVKIWIDEIAGLR